MLKKQRFATIATAIALGLGGAASAHAQDSFGGYIGASFGDSDFSASGYDGSSSYRIFGGYMYTPNVGVEVGFSDLGGFDGRGGATVDVDGAYIAGVGSYMVADGFSVVGKLGAYHYEIDGKAGGTRNTDDGTSAMLGIGVNYHMNPALALGAEYSLVNDVEDEDVGTIWLNVQYSMGAQ